MLLSFHHVFLYEKDTIPVIVKKSTRDYSRHIHSHRDKGHRLPSANKTCYCQSIRY